MKPQKNTPPISVPFGLLLVFAALVPGLIFFFALVSGGREPVAPELAAASASAQVPAAAAEIAAPNVLNCTETDARQRLGYQKLTMEPTTESSEIVPSGRVIKQWPSPGQPVQANQPVKVWFSIGPEIAAPPAAAPPDDPAPISDAPKGQEKASGLVVCIDPGHPSEVGEGTQGKRITEIQAAWRVAKKVKHLLEEQGATVVLTKQSENQKVTNRRRAEIANEARANLMVRLHCDDASGTGIATFAPDRQGESGGVTGPSPGVINASQRAARIFHAVMVAQLKGALGDRGLKPDTETSVGAKQGALTGSIFSHVPVLLVEMCILNNPHDEAFIASEKGQWALADAIARGTLAALQQSKQTRRTAEQP